MKTRLKHAGSVYWAAYLALQFFLARTLKIDFYDAFGYLRNSRRLAGAPVGYSTFRPALIALIHAPLQRVLDLAGAAPPARLWAPHVLQTLISAACVAAVYLWLRRRLSPGWAQVGAVAFSLNRMTVHYFSSVMSDIPATLFMLLFFLAEGSELASTLALAACFLCRWNMPLVPVCLALCGGDRKRLLRQAAAAGLIWLLVNLAVFQAVYGLDFVAGARVLAETLRWDLSTNSVPMPRSAYFFMTTAAFGVIPLLILLFGIAARMDAPVGFAALFLAAMTLGIGQKQSRYLFPILPFLCLFFARGLKGACERIPKEYRAALVAAALFFCGLGAAREWLRFADPVYRSPLILEAADALSREKARHIYWEGFAPTLAPSRPGVADDALAYSIYQVPNFESMEYFLGRSLAKAEDGPPPEPGDLDVHAPRRPPGDIPPAPEKNLFDVLRLSAAKRWELIARLNAARR